MARSLVLLAIILTACGGGTAEPGPSDPATPSSAASMESIDLTQIVISPTDPPDGMGHDETIEGAAVLTSVVISGREPDFLALPGFRDALFTKFSGEGGAVLSIALSFDTPENATTALDLYLDELRSDAGYGFGAGRDAELGDEGTCDEGANPALDGLPESICVWRDSSLVLIVGGPIDREHLRGFAEAMDEAAGVATLSAPDDPAPSPAVNAFKGGSLRSPAGDGHSATLLPDGRVLVISGTWVGMDGATVGSAELWDPVEGSSTPTGPLVTGRPHATATLLSDGRVLVVGGFGGWAYSSTALAMAELWDTESGTFREAGSLAQPRVGHTATRLQDGRVLVIGGSGPDGQLASAELWDPTTESFRSAGSLATTRSRHTATLLPDGRVLVVGGSTSTNDGATMSFVTVAELWDPSRGSFIPAGELVEPRVGHTATLLSDGRVLVVGGYIGSGFTSGFDDEGRNVVLHAPADLVDGHLASAEVWDPSGLSFSATGLMSQARTGHTATLLTDGRVALIGGAGIRVEGEALFVEERASVEVWDPATGSFAPARPLASPRHGHSAIRLSNGQLLIVGARSGATEFESNSVEVWGP